MLIREFEPWLWGEKKQLLVKEMWDCLGRAQKWYTVWCISWLWLGAVSISTLVLVLLFMPRL